MEAIEAYKSAGERSAKDSTKVRVVNARDMLEQDEVTCRKAG
jgi:hypothetical protein